MARAEHTSDLTFKVNLFKFIVVFQLSTYKLQDNYIFFYLPCKIRSFEFCKIYQSKLFKDHSLIIYYNHINIIILLKLYRNLL